jgi:hypothetical protein
VLTIFTTCRPFEHGFLKIQRNALESWKRLEPEPEVLIIGDERGAAEAAKRYACRHIPEVERNRWGTPLLRSIFGTALALADWDVLCYINSDIIVLSELTGAVAAVCERLKEFMMTGPRWDLERDFPGFVDAKWEMYFRRSLAVGRVGRRHKPTGLDWFVFTRGVYNPAEFPPLAVGRTEWDAWLVWAAMTHNRQPVVDATQAVTVAHQFHEKRDGKTVEKGLNRALAFERTGRGYLWDASFRLGPGPEFELEKLTAEMLWRRHVGWDWQ